MNLDNRDYAPREQWFTWRGNTSDRGEFLSDIPAGRYYDVDVQFPSSASMSNWTFLGVWFGDTPVVLRPTPVVQIGKIHPPAAVSMEIDTGGGSFTRRHWLPTGSWRTEYAWFYDISPVGVFRVELPAAGRYRAAVEIQTQDARLSLGFADSVQADTADTLHFYPRFVKFMVHTTLAGNFAAVVPFELRLESVNQGTGVDWSRLYLEAIGGAPVVAWGVTAPARLSISPLQSAPFLPTSLAITPLAESDVTIELGLHRATVQVLSAGGAPAIGTRVRFELPLGEWSGVAGAFGTNAEGEATCFLNPGSYYVSAVLNSTTVADTTVRVDHDVFVILRFEAPPSR